MKHPTRILIRPGSAAAFLRPAFILDLLRFRWRLVLAVLTLATPLAVWTALRPYSATAVIYVEGLGPGGILTNVDCARIPLTDAPR
jgi:uncharacterized protein involved in exopolysaccharide biosynthesis